MRMAPPPRSWESGAAGPGRAGGITRNESADLLAFGRGQDAHQLAILRHRAPRDVDLLLAEHLGDVLVAERLAGVLLGDDLTDLLLDALRGHLGPLTSAEARREEVLQLERALRRVHVLPGRRPADRRLVHADVVGH